MEFVFQYEIDCLMDIHLLRVVNLARKQSVLYISWNIVAQIGTIINEARKRVYSAVNTEMVLAYWNIGRIIVEAQGGNSRASYGEELLFTISQRLTAEFGKGFDPSNLRNMRSFFLAYPNCDTLCHNLSWSHYRKLMRVTNPKAREYYTQEASNGQWSVRQLERQIATQYYERLLSTQRYPRH